MKVSNYESPRNSSQSKIMRVPPTGYSSELSPEKKTYSIRYDFDPESFTFELYDPQGHLDAFVDSCAAPAGVAELTIQQINSSILRDIKNSKNIYYNPKFYTYTKWGFLVVVLLTMVFFGLITLSSYYFDNEFLAILGFIFLLLGVLIEVVVILYDGEIRFTRSKKILNLKDIRAKQRALEIIESFNSKLIKYSMKFKLSKNSQCLNLVKI